VNEFRVIFEQCIVIYTTVVARYAVLVRTQKGLL